MSKTVDITTLPGYPHLPDGDYNITVIAEGEGFRPSPASQPVSYTKLPNPGVYTDTTYTAFATLPAGTDYAGQPATWSNLKLAYPGAFATAGTIKAKNGSVSYFPDTLVGDLIISSEITSIGFMAFRYCTGLTGVTIPSSVTSIGESAFVGCSGLIRATIGSGVISIGGSAFRYCSGLTGTLTIPDSVTSIGSWAFYGCSGLTSITIPNSVTSIELSAFAGCTSLTTLLVNANYNNTDNSNTLTSGQNYGYGQNPNLVNTFGYNNINWNKVN